MISPKETGSGFTVVDGKGKEIARRLNHRKWRGRGRMKSRRRRRR